MNDLIAKRFAREGDKWIKVIDEHVCIEITGSLSAKTKHFNIYVYEDNHIIAQSTGIPSENLDTELAQIQQIINHRA